MRARVSSRHAPGEGNTSAVKMSRFDPGAMGIVVPGKEVTFTIEDLLSVRGDIHVFPPNHRWPEPVVSLLGAVRSRFE